MNGNKQVIQIGKGDADQSSKQSPIHRSQDDVVSPAGKTMYKVREPSSDDDSNTAEAVGNIVRLHSTQQKTLCGSKNFISSNDYHMDHDLLLDEQQSSRRECEGHILKVDLSGLEPKGEATPIQTKETVLKKKTPLKSLILLNASKNVDANEEDSNNKSHTGLEESFSVRLQEVNVIHSVGAQSNDYDPKKDVVQSQKLSPQKQAFKHNLKIDTKAKEQRVFSQPAANSPERRVLHLKNQVFEGSALEQSLPQHPGYNHSVPTSSKKNFKYLSTSISNAEQAQAEASAAHHQTTGGQVTNVKLHSHKKGQNQSKLNRHGNQKARSDRKSEEKKGTGRIERGHQSVENEQMLLKGQQSTAAPTESPQKTGLLKNTHSFDQREEQISLMINTTMQNRQLVGYKVHSQPSLNYNQDIDHINLGLQSANLDLEAVTKQRCETCELLFEQQKNLIRNRQAHGKPTASSQRRQLLDSLLQNRPTCPECKRRRINQARGGTRFRTGGFLHASSPAQAKKQQRMKHIVEGQYRSGHYSSARRMSEQGSQTEGPSPMGAEATENYTLSQNEERLPLIDVPLQNMYAQRPPRFGDQMQQESLEVNTLMHVGGLEDIDGLYHGQTNAGLKSVDIDIGDNGADSTIRIENLQAAVRNLSDLSNYEHAAGADEGEVVHQSVTPELKSIDMVQPASSNLSIPKQPADINSSLPNDDSHSISSPLKNEQIYSSFRQKRLSHHGDRVDTSAPEKSSSQGIKQSQANNSKKQFSLKKSPSPARESNAGSQPVYSTYKQHDDRQAQKIPMINYRYLKHGGLSDAYDQQQVGMDKPNLDGVLQTISLQDTKRGDEQGSALNRFSNVKPQKTNYNDMFNNQSSQVSAHTPNYEGPCTTPNIVLGQNALIELQMFNNGLDNYPLDINAGLPSSSPETDYTNLRNQHQQHFDNQQLRSFIQQQMESTTLEHRTMFGHNLTAPPNTFQVTGNANAGALDPHAGPLQQSSSHNSSGEGIIIEYRDDNDSIKKMFGWNLNVPPGNQAGMNGPVHAAGAQPHVGVGSHVSSTPVTYMEPTMSPYLRRPGNVDQVSIRPIQMNDQQIQSQSPSKHTTTEQLPETTITHNRTSLNQSSIFGPEPSSAQQRLATSQLMDLSPTNLPLQSVQYFQLQNSYEEQTPYDPKLTENRDKREVPSTSTKGKAFPKAVNKALQIKVSSKSNVGQAMDTPNQQQMDTLQSSANASSKIADMSKMRARDRIREEAGKFQSVDHFMSQRYRCSVEAERKREIMARKRQALNKSKENATEINMMTTTRQSEQKNYGSAFGDKPFPMPRSRVSDRYTSGEARSTDCKNVTQFKERPKEQPELAQVSISKVRVFKSKEQEQELAASHVQSPIIRQSLSIDKTTDFAANKSNSQLEQSELRQLGDLDDNRALSTHREQELNTNNKIRMFVPQVETENDELLSALNQIDAGQRRRLSQRISQQQVDAVQQEKENGLRESNQVVEKQMKNQEASPYISPREVKVKTMAFCADDFKADKRTGMNSDIYKIALSSKRASLRWKFEPTQSELVESFRRRTKQQQIQDVQNELRKSSQNFLDQHIFDNNLINISNQQLENAIDRWEATKDKRDSINLGQRMNEENQEMSAFSLYNKGDSGMKQPNNMPLYRSLEIQEGKFELVDYNYSAPLSKVPPSYASPRQTSQSIGLRPHPKKMSRNTRRLIQHLSQRRQSPNILNLMHANPNVLACEPRQSVDQIEVAEFKSNAYDMRFIEPATANKETMQNSNANASTNEPMVDTTQPKYNSQHSQLPGSSRYEESSLLQESVGGSPRLQSVKDSTREPIETGRFRKSQRQGKNPALRQSYDYHFTQAQSTQRNVDALSTIMSKQESKQAHYRKSVHYRQFQSIKENLEESLRTFRKSQKLRQFIEDTNGALEYRQGNIGRERKELQANVGLNARIKRLKNMDIGATMTRRGSCFAMQTHQQDRLIAIEKIRKSLESQQLIPTEHFATDIKSQTIVVGDQDSPTANWAFDAEKPKQATAAGQTLDNKNNQDHMQMPKLKANALRRKTERMFPMYNHDYVDVKNMRTVLATAHNSQEIVLKESRFRSVNKVSTESTKQNPDSSLYREMNVRANRLTESLQSAKSRNAANTRMQQKSAETGGKVNVISKMPKTIYSSMYKPGPSRKKSLDNKDLHLEVPENTISAQETGMLDQGAYAQSLSVPGYTMDSKSILDEKLLEDEHHTIDIGSPTVKDENAQTVNHSQAATTEQLFYTNGKTGDRRKFEVDVMQKLKLPTIKVDGMRPRQSREVKRSSIDNQYFKNGFALIKQPNVRIIKPQRHSLIEVSTAFENTSLKGWREHTESNASLFRPVKSKTKAPPSPERKELAEQVEKIMIDSKMRKISSRSPVQIQQSKFVQSIAAKRPGNYLYKMYQDYARTLDAPATTGKKTATAVQASSSRAWPSKIALKPVALKSIDKRK